MSPKPDDFMSRPTTDVIHDEVQGIIDCGEVDFVHPVQSGIYPGIEFIFSRADENSIRVEIFQAHTLTITSNGTTVDVTPIAEYMFCHIENNKELQNANI